MNTQLEKFELLVNNIDKMSQRKMDKGIDFSLLISSNGNHIYSDGNHVYF